VLPAAVTFSAMAGGDTGPAALLGRRPWRLPAPALGAAGKTDTETELNTLDNESGRHPDDLSHRQNSGQIRQEGLAVCVRQFAPEQVAVLPAEVPG